MLSLMGCMDRSCNIKGPHALSDDSGSKHQSVVFSLFQGALYLGCVKHSS